MRFIKRVSERGVLTLPTEIREALDVQDGDLVEFEVLRVVKKANGSAPSPPIASLREKDSFTNEPLTGGR